MLGVTTCACPEDARRARQAGQSFHSLLKIRYDRSFFEEAFVQISLLRALAYTA
jgi:hypothetical protein